MVNHVGANKKANSPLFAFAAIGPGTPLLTLCGLTACTHACGAVNTLAPPKPEPLTF